MQYDNSLFAGNFLTIFLSRSFRYYVTLLGHICHIAYNLKTYHSLIAILFMTLLTSNSAIAQTTQIRVATFNVSMEGTNYAAQGTLGDGMLADILQKGIHPQVRNIAQIIQRTRPDVILLNEFDYIANSSMGVELFLNNFLAHPQAGAQAIAYPYYFLAPVNTGMPSPFDLDRDGIASGLGNDAWGFGNYPGQYGMLLLSRFPIDANAARTFQTFKWADLPGAQTPMLDNAPYFTDSEWQALRLSSKSHWDIPIDVNGEIIHVLASHPTPPVFDGPERRNALRNRDEIRFWTLYIDPVQGSHLYDDKGVYGGLPSETRFVILGDLNASADEGDSLQGGIDVLLQNEHLQSDIVPSSEGAVAHSPENPRARNHTAQWGMRADYVLPSRRGFAIKNAGVFWPPAGAPFAPLVQDRGASSDHRLVWLDLELKPLP